MRISIIRYFSVFLLSMVLAFYIDFLRVPLWLNIGRPEFSLLILCGWVLNYPQKTHMGTAFFIGLIVDILRNTLLGSHAFSYGFVVFLILLFRKRLYLLPLWQQTIFMYPIFIIYQTIIMLIDKMDYGLSPGWLLLLPAIGASLIWPLIQYSFQRHISFLIQASSTFKKSMNMR